jgi:hypothetical protein
MHQVYCSTLASCTLLIIFSELLKFSNFCFFAQILFLKENRESDGIFWEVYDLSKWNPQN